MRAAPLAAVVALALVGCPGGGGAEWTPPAAPPDDVKAAVAGTNQFAIELYRAAAAGTKGDVLLSPASVAAALGMTLAGAQGATADQLTKALRLTLPPGRTHAALGALLGAGPELAVANRLWGGQEAFLAPFLATTGASYGAALEQVDFANDPAGAREAINAWVADRTHDQLEELVRPEDVDALTRLVLTNAVHFKGDWQRAFEEEHTREGPFTLATGERVQTPFMWQALLTFGYQGEGFVLVELPYKGARYAMVVIVPAAHDGLPALERALTADALTAWLDGAQAREIAVSLPRFTLEASLDLTSVLGALGVKDVFDPIKADLSGMTGKKDALHLAAARHAARIEVDEAGTRVTAASSHAAGATSAPPPAIEVDRPFLFLIRDRDSGLIWFMGRETDPRS